MNINNTPTPTGMKIIKASAGSGKTFMLAQSYIEQLLFKPSTTMDKNGKPLLELRWDPKRQGVQPNYHQHILAITFTNKATNEMKERIIKELYVLSSNPLESDHYDTFKTRCVPQDIDLLQQAAAQALAAILFDYSSFRVKTIDSFFQQVLRSFARELDRDGGYELEINGNYAVAAATHNFLLSLGRDAVRSNEDLTPAEEWVKEHLKQNTANNKGWTDLFANSSRNDSLSKKARKINDEFFREHMDDIKKYLSDSDGNTYLGRINAFKKALIDAAKAYEETFNSLNSTLLNDLHQAFALASVDESTLRGNGKLANLLSGKTTISEDNLDKTRPMCDNLAQQFKKNAPVTEELLSNISQLVGNVCRNLEFMTALNETARKLSFLGLLGEIHKKLEEYCQESNTVLIADTNDLIDRVVKSAPDAPFIYERMGTWINHYMLDEFQDTSRKQYENFLPLLDESISHATDNFNLIIGDAKQAIYRFRNADPSLFREQVNIKFTGHQSQTLDTNWRSQRNIIEFNNEFIDHMLELTPASVSDTCNELVIKTYKPEGKRDDYAQHVSPNRDKKPAGMVRVLFKDFDGNELKDRNDVTPMMVKYFTQLHERFAWNEILVLVNAHKDGQEIVEAILDHNKRVRGGKLAEGESNQVIPVVSAEMMALARSTAVRRIIGMLRFIDLTSYVMHHEDESDDTGNRNDSIRQAANRKRLKAQRQFVALGKFVAAVGNREFDNPCEVGDILKQCFSDTDSQAGKSAHEQMDNYADLLNALLPASDTQVMSLAGIVEHLIANHLASNSNNGDENIFLHALQNLVLAWSSKRNGGTIREFLHFWDDNSDKINVPAADGVDAINVMTIHASKGLEAECVVIPCASWKLNGSKDTEYWFTKEDWINGGGIGMIEQAGVKIDKGDIPPVIAMPLTHAQCMTTYSMFKDTVDKFVADTLIDNINKTYVAFTRPRKELHVFSVGGWPRQNNRPIPLEKVSTSDNINHLMMHVVDKMKDKFIAVDGKDGWYQMGEPYVDTDKIHAGENNQATAITPDDDPSNMPQYAVSKHQVHVLLPDDVNSMREVGKRLHALLSRINDRDDLDAALSWGERRGIIIAGREWNREHISSMLQAIDSDPQVAQWFDKGNTVLNERPLLVVNDDGSREFKRPDRIVKRADGSYIIVDYKFGDRHDNKHSRQVKQYMKTLHEATGASVEGYVWYVTAGEVLSV